MTEAERLSKICQEQDKELKRLRRLLGTCRIACAEYNAEGNVLQVVVTCVGVDEYLFLEKCKPELKAIADALVGKLGSVEMDVENAHDAITGEPLARRTVSKDDGRGDEKGASDGKD